MMVTDCINLTIKEKKMITNNIQLIISKKMCESPVFYLLKMCSFTPYPKLFFCPNFEVWKKSVHLKKKTKGLSILKDFLFSVLKETVMS